MGKKLVVAGVDKVNGLIFGLKRKFKIGSENHELWVEKSGSKNVVMMASKPKPALEYVEKIPVDSEQDKNVKLVKEQAIETINSAQNQSEDELKTEKPQKRAIAAIKKLRPETGVSGESKENNKPKQMD